MVTYKSLCKKERSMVSAKLTKKVGTQSSCVSRDRMERSGGCTISEFPAPLRGLPKRRRRDRTIAWGLGPRNQVLRPVIQALKERRTFLSGFFSFAPLGLASCVVLRFPGVLTPGYYPRPLRGRLGDR